MKNLMNIFVVCVMLLLVLHANGQQQSKPKMLGMYLHQHWSYNHPYAVRTWTIEDWRGYIGGIQRLGYNTILIWPMLEIMPEPLTPSDEKQIALIAKVIDMAHNDFKMGAYIVLCPNVSPKSEEGRKYTFQNRPFFHTDDRVDPGDPVAFGKLMAWREKLFAPLAAADGLFIIDSDPGGYPNSTNMEFVYILGAHRRMLDKLRPGIEVVYWSHFGWESYGKFYATGKLVRGKDSEPVEAVSLFSKQRSEPWGIATSGFPPNFVDSIGQGHRVISFPYGSIEGEPSFPLTIYGGDRAYNGGKKQGQRGVMGNAQTHCVQLPNTFAFARGAQGMTVEKEDYIEFANDLIPDQGTLIVESWEALQGQDTKRMKNAVKRLSRLKSNNITAGDLKGLLFGDPARFINDLVLQLQLASSMYDFRSAVNQGTPKSAAVKRALSSLVSAAEAWQGKHGYSNSWSWRPMEEALRKLGSEQLNATLNSHKFTSDEGDTPFDKVKNGLAQLESYSPRLIASMRKALEEMK